MYISLCAPFLCKLRDYRIRQAGEMCAIFECISQFVFLFGVKSEIIGSAELWNCTLPLNVLRRFVLIFLVKFMSLRSAELAKCTLPTNVYLSLYSFSGYNL